MIITYDQASICSRNYHGVTIIYDLANKLILKLTDVASDIWTIIYSKHSVLLEDIVSRIAEEYDCEVDEIRNDTLEFVKELYDAGIVGIDGHFVTLNSGTPSVSYKETDDFEGQIIQELREDNQLYSITFEMTYACNEKCIHCYAHYPGIESVSTYIEIEKYKTLIDELYEMNCMHICFTGGDPFMYKDFLNIFQYARTRGFVCDIFTNGQYLFSQRDELQAIARLKPRAFYISLYGATANTHDMVTGVKGSFEKTISVVEELHRYGVPVVFNVMIMTVNYHETKDIINLARRIGVEYRVNMSLIYTNAGSDSPLQYFVNDKEMIKDTFRLVDENMFSMDIPMDMEKEAYMCGAGLSSLSVSPDGSVFPCVSIKDRLGNIYKNSLKEIWNGKKRKAFIKKMKWENTEECTKCLYFQQCPHCPGMSEAETGSVFSCNTCDRIIAESLYELEKE